MFCVNCGSPLSGNDQFCPQCGIQLTQQTDLEPVLRRALMFVRENKWGKADDYCEQVLDRDPENAQAYVIKLMIRAQVKNEEDLAAANASYADWNSYQNACRYADEELRQRLEGYLQQTLDRLRLKEEEAQRREAERIEADKLQRKNNLYVQARRYDQGNSTIYDLKKAIELYHQIPDHMDASGRLLACKQRLKELEEQKAQQLLEQQELEVRMQRKKKLSFLAFSVVLLVVIIVFFNTVSASHTKRASEIAQRLENTRFVGTHNEFGSYVANGSWGLYESRTQKETTFRFQDSKTVVVDTVTRYDNYPFITKNGEIQWDRVTSDTKTYYGYQVDVSFFGRVTVTVNGVQYQMDVNTQNDPLSITSDGKSFERKLG